MALKTSYTQSGGRGQGSKRGGKMGTHDVSVNDSTSGMKPYSGNSSANPRPNKGK